MLHELATDAGKYGALSTDPGRVNVCWRTEDNTFPMSWIESDGPLVSAPERRGFGTMVMEEMALIKIVDIESFRERLRAANFYRNWRQSVGEEAWALMEAKVGKVG